MSSTTGITVKINPSLYSLKEAFDHNAAELYFRDEIQKIAFRVERFAKQLTPVDSGRLRASISTGWLISIIGAEVTTNVDYAIYVHEGTRYMRARPFMTRGAEMAQQYIEGDIKARVDVEFAKAFKTL